MRKISSLFSKVVRDENGTETLEYAIVLGLIIVAALGLVLAVGTKASARWTSVNTKM
jgi:Flp pilus assembly pilin Flp